MLAFILFLRETGNDLLWGVTRFFCIWRHNVMKSYNELIKNINRSEKKMKYLTL